MFFASNAAAPGKSASDASAAVREKPRTVKSQSCRECLSTKYVNVVKAAVLVVLSLQMHTGVCSLSYWSARTYWRYSWKPFYESLVTKCFEEESYTDSQLKRVTKVSDLINIA